MLTGIPDEARALAAEAGAPDTPGADGAGPSGGPKGDPPGARVRPLLPGSGLEDLASAGAPTTTAELRVRDRRAVLGIGISNRADHAHSVAHPTDMSLPALLERLDVGCLDDPPVDPVLALAALHEGTTGGVLEGPAAGAPSALVVATQGLMRSNVMAAVEVLKVFYKAAGVGGGGGEDTEQLHMAPDKAVRYRTALSKQHHTYVVFCGKRTVHNM